MDGPSARGIVRRTTAVADRNTLRPVGVISTLAIARP